jgi:hypothetical protein
MKLALIVSTILLCGTLLGCGSSACSDQLSGSGKNNYDLECDAIEIFYQQSGGTFQAAIVQYIRGAPNERQIPVKVIANAPVEAGVTKNYDPRSNPAPLSLTRAMSDGSSFPDITVGSMTFDDFDGPGTSTSGKFYFTFESGRTINGEFSGTFQQLGQ